MKDLSYTKLNEQVTKEDFDNYKKFIGKNKAKKPAPKRTLIAIGLVILFLPLIIQTDTLLGAIQAVLSGAVVYTLIGIPVYLLVKLGQLVRRGMMSTKVRMYKFSLENDIEFKPGGSLSGLDGFIFNRGHTRISSNQFNISDDIQISDYSYVTGSGKSRTVHPWSYIRIQLNRRLPHMILDSKRNNFLKRFSNIPADINKSQTLSLEGDFDKYFTLYAPKKYETDALYVFTPDVMQALIEADSIQPLDMEIIDDHLFIYQKGYFDGDSEENWRNAVKLIDTIKSKVHKQTHFYADSRVGDRSLNMITDKGARLKRNKITLSAVITFLIIGFYILMIFASN